MENVNDRQSNKKNMSEDKSEKENQDNNPRFSKRLSTNNPNELPSVFSKKEEEILERRTSLRPPRKDEVEELEVDEEEQEKESILGFKKKVIQFLLTHWQGLTISLIVLVVTIRCLCRPSPIEKRVWCIFVVLFFWFSDVVPSSIAGMIPIAISPLLGLLDSESVAIEYLSESTVLILCSYIISAVIESCKLHKLIAVRLLQIVGFRVKILHAIMMAAVFVVGSFSEETFVGSFFAAITKAILIILEEEEICTMYERTNADKEKGFSRPSKIALGYYIGISFVIVVGEPSVFLSSVYDVLNDHFETEYKNKTGPDYITYGNYTGFCFPCCFFMAIVIVFQMQFMYLGLFRSNAFRTKCGYLSMDQKHRRKLDPNKYRKYLKRPEMDQFIVIVCTFIVMISDVTSSLLKWHYLDHFNVKLGPSMHSVAVVIALSILPRKLTFLNYLRRRPKMWTKTEMSSILRWSHVIEKVEWGTVMIQGAWNVLAKITFDSGVVTKLVDSAKSLKTYSEKTIIFILMTLTWILTQFCDTNTITIRSIEYIRESLKGENALQNNPIHLFLPVALIAKMSFMLPISQTCGILILEKYHIKTKDFLIAGLFPTLLTFLTIYIFTLSTISLYFRKIEAYSDA